MNYRHAFHAGNFADVVKHAIFARILDYLGRKAAPFRFLDTHAGAGRYDLTSTEAKRSPEWRDGIARVLTARRLRRSPRCSSPISGRSGRTTRTASRPPTPARRRSRRR